MTPATDERKNVGWYLAWVVAPALVAGGGAVVAARGGTGGMVAGAGAILGTAFVLWRRFWP